MKTRYGQRITERRLTRRRLLLVSSQASVAGLLYACGGGADNEDDDTGDNKGGTPETRATSTPLPTVVPSELKGAKYGGTIKIGYSGGSITNFDPHTSSSGAEHQFFFPVMDPLIGYDQKGNLDPSVSLAEEWELAEPTRIVLTLRQGVKYSDGTDFNADAVKWNLNRILDPAGNATPRADLEAIDSVDAVDARTISLNLRQPSAPLLTNFGDLGGQMISPTAFERMSADAFRRTPVGTGPLVLKEWRDDAFIVYEKNPLYWRKDAAGNQLPYLDAVRIEIMPDTTVRTAAFESGGIDVLIGPAATDVARLVADSRFQTVDFVGSGVSLWYVNHSFAPLDNVWFRRAFASALDRENYIKNFLVGDEQIANGFLTPATWAYDPTVQTYGFDIAKARQYLEQSGLPESEWKIRTQPFGATISDAELFWQESLKEAGITLDWAQPERDGWKNRVLTGLGGDGSAGLYWSGYVMHVDPDGGMRRIYEQRGPYNSGQAPSPEVEPLLAKARETYEQAERKQLYSEALKAAAEQLYSIIPGNYNVARGFSQKSVGNFSAWFAGDGKPRFANLWI